MGDGAHLVGHSYGGLGVMLAAARRPDATRSITLLEPPTPVPGGASGSWQALEQQIRDLWHADLDDRDWVVRFLRLVGSDPDQFPPEMLDLAVPLVPVFRRGRPFFTAEVPFAALAAAPFPKLVVSGGHLDAFESMSDALAAAIGGARVVIEGAGHEIQFTGTAINEAMGALWRSVR
jgi:pimeloyl-ACP methyl ester carboxylesterase